MQPRKAFNRVFARILLGLIVATGVPSSGAAEPVQYAGVRELKVLPLEQLVETPVISASRVPQPWFTAPQAIDVLSDEEIRRTGVVRLPEALRYATGLEVMRFVGSSYAISARGFSSVAANKMQILLDGRSLYTPLLSGVFWEVQDTLLEDLERIEVGRGPGATMWGANAVNGVIHIISKSARDTQGLLVMGGAGDEERLFAGVRYGGRLAENSFYRVYVKQHNRDDQKFASGEGSGDHMYQTQIGFRTDTYFLGTDQLTVQGDGYVNEFGVNGRDNAENEGGNILARWSRDLAEYGDVRIQTYYDGGQRDVPLQFRELRHTFDIEGQHHFTAWDRHNVVWGAGYRRSWDETGQTDRTFRFDPHERTIDLVSGFVQNEITIDEEWLKITLGSRFEHNSFTGFEVQPGARFAVTPHPDHMIWGGITRAVRSPTRAEDDMRFSPSPAGVPVVVIGSDEFKSEELLAYEAGYRVKPWKTVAIDIASFYNDYQNLRTQEPSRGPGGIPLTISNQRHGEIYGAEFALKVQPTDWIRLGASYTRMEQELRFRRISRDPTGGSAEGNDPGDFAVVHLGFDLPGDVEVDVYGRYMDSLTNPQVPSYFAVDARIGWHVNDNLEVSLVGQNLTDPQHREFGDRSFPEVERSVYGKATVRF